MNNNYKIVFSGILKDGVTEEAFIQSFTSTFKIPDSQVRKLLSAGRPVTLKDKLDQTSAEKYCQLMDKLGMQVHIETTSDGFTLAPSAATRTQPEAERNKSKPSLSKRCPNCGSERIKDDDCLACGVIISRFMARKERLQQEKEQEFDAPLPKEKSRINRWQLLIASVAIIAIGTAFYLRRSHTSIESVTTLFNVETKEGMISLGDAHAVTINSSGHIYGFGSNFDHVLGYLYTKNVPIPKLIADNTAWHYVTTGDNVSLAIDVRGRLWRRMYVSDYDKARRGAHDNVLDQEISPFKMIPYLEIDTQLRFSKALESNRIALALDLDQKLWAWHEEQKSEYSFARGLNEPAPQRTLVQPTQKWRDFCVNRTGVVAIDTSGALWRSSSDDFDKFRAARDDTELNLTKDKFSEVALQRVFCHSHAGHVVLMDVNGELRGYGGNSHGEFGTRTRGLPVTPDAYSNASKWIFRMAPGQYAEIATGAGYTLAIRKDGSLWGWGINTDHQLGIANKSGSDEPMLIDDKHTWIAIAADHYFSAGITSDGVLYTWGNDHEGGLGAGGGSSHPIPFPVSSNEKWGGPAK